MISEAHGNLLDAEVDAHVNTVNTVGVMGKGIALQFKRAYPTVFKAYAAARAEIQPARKKRMFGSDHAAARQPLHDEGWLRAAVAA